MADKPRVKAPRQRKTAGPDDASRGRLLLVVAGAAALAVLVVALVFVVASGGGGGASPEAARTALADAGCTFEVKPAVANVSDHSDFAEPGGTSEEWNTDPPTSGPHYGETLIYGAYTEPVEIGRVLHNLEHGAAYILYGDGVSDATVAQLQAFYDEHENGTVLAPYPKLGSQIALGAWLVEGLPEASSSRGSGVLAKCPGFDEAAYAAFFDAFQFKGPESSIIPPSSMQPGDN
jgi:hypothetical protein